MLNQSDTSTIELRHIKALLVDDSGSMRDILRALLGTIGIMKIDTENNGKSAIAAIRTKPYDLIVCDWEMPGVGGIDVLKYVREHKNTTTIPFIMCTSGNSKENIIKAMELGVDEYLIKPFSQQKFKTKIITVLNKQRA